ncbi:MAG TPA: hypothetical protein VKU91_03765 [Acidimicrobiales bacterium]|nr:hypothetical protein [Acidimicrobiales bacterium]
MPAGQWLDRSQPQTLQIATMLLYVNAVLGVLFLTILNPIGAAFVVGQAVSGYGIANQRKWAYWLAVGLSVLILAVIVYTGAALSIINLLFQVALVVLLLHPQSRRYKSVWFR